MTQRATRYAVHVHAWDEGHRVVREAGVSTVVIDRVRHPRPRRVSTAWPTRSSARTRHKRRCSSPFVVIVHSRPVRADLSHSIYKQSQTPTLQSICRQSLPHPILLPSFLHRRRSFQLQCLSGPYQKERSSISLRASSSTTLVRNMFVKTLRKHLPDNISTAQAISALSFVLTWVRRNLALTSSYSDQERRIFKRTRGR